MNAATKPLAELIQQLPPDAQAEVRDFVEFLLVKRARRSGHTLQQDWAGSLSHARDQYTSLELQQKALDWRGD